MKVAEKSVCTENKEEFHHKLSCTELQWLYLQGHEPTLSEVTVTLLKEGIKAGVSQIFCYNYNYIFYNKEYKSMIIKRNKSL